MAYGKAEDVDDATDCGEEDEADDATVVGGQKKARRKANYAVPTLPALPEGVGPRDLVVALTCFQLHSEHPSEVATRTQSQSTTTQNVPGSAGQVSSNNTCRCVQPSLPFCFALSRFECSYAELRLFLRKIAEKAKGICFCAEMLTPNALFAAFCYVLFGLC